MLARNKDGFFAEKTAYEILGQMLLQINHCLASILHESHLKRGSLETDKYDHNYLRTMTFMI